MKGKKERRTAFRIVLSEFKPPDNEAHALQTWEGLAYTTPVAIARGTRELLKRPGVKWKHFKKYHFDVEKISHEEFAANGSKKRNRRN